MTGVPEPVLVVVSDPADTPLYTIGTWTYSKLNGAFTKQTIKQFETDAAPSGSCYFGGSNLLPEARLVYQKQSFPVGF